MILLTLTLGSRKYFLPRSAFIPDDGLLHAEILKIPFSIFPRLLCSSLLQFPTSDISLRITSHTCYSYNHSLLPLLLQDTLNYSLTFKNLLCHCLEILCYMFTSTNNSSHLARICSFLVDQVIQKIFWNTIRSSDNPLQLLLWKYLYACITDTFHMSGKIQ